LLFALVAGQSSTLSRSHSIASAGDKSLILSTVGSSSSQLLLPPPQGGNAASSPPSSSAAASMHHPSLRHELSTEQRLLHELQITKK